MKVREGWEWKNGYWSKVDDTARHKHKLDFFCPHCSRITGTIDDAKMEKYGICAECYVMYIEDREVPAIDLSKYKK